MIVYCADIHLTDKQPINRVTPIQPNAIVKLEKIFSIAKNNGKVLIMGGDLFESPCPSYSLFSQVVDVFLRNKDVKVYGILGNHDIVYGDTESHNNAIQTLVKMGLYTRLSNKPVTLDGVQVFGIDYKKGLYTEDDAVKECNLATNGDVLVTHQFMSPKTLPFNHISLDAFNNTSFWGTVLCSHLHDPFIKTVDKTLFVNPGCVCRLNRNESVIEPSVVVFTGSCFSKPKVVSLESGPVEFLENTVKKETFMKSIDDAKVEVTDIETYLESAGESQEVVQEAKRLIKKHSDEV